MHQNIDFKVFILSFLLFLPGLVQKNDVNLMILHLQASLLGQGTCILPVWCIIADQTRTFTPKWDEMVL